MIHQRPLSRGFSMIELVVVISIMVILVGMGVTMVSDELAKARDVRRVEDVKTLVRALEAYLEDTGTLPDGDVEPAGNGWDTTADGEFLSALVDGGYLRETVLDPLGSPYMFRYCHYPRGYQGFSSDFYVIGIAQYETNKFASNKGHWSGTTRDWSQEFAYVVGGTSR